MFCARCHEPTVDAEICSHCGNPPLLAEQYRFEKLLGHGAAGTTWRTRRTTDNSICVVKEISFRRLVDFKSLELFEREAQVLKNLDHPAIPDYIDDLVIEDGRHVNIYIVQQFVDGRSLEPGGQGWTEPMLLDFLEEIADILVYLGDSRPPVVHRDIKPSNILCDEQRYYLIDFGAASIIGGDGSGSTVAGTFGFMAPEQMRGEATPATDIYGLGATALALATGRDPSDLIQPGSPGVWREDVALSPSFAALLMRMLQPDPAERINAARQLKWEIEQTRRALANATAPTPRPRDRPPALVPAARNHAESPELHWLNRYTESPKEALGRCLLVPFILYVGAGALLLALSILATIFDALYKPVFTRFLDLILVTYEPFDILLRLFVLGVSGVWLLYFIGPTWQARATGAPSWWPRWRRLNRSWLFRSVLRESFSWSLASRVFSFVALGSVATLFWLFFWALEPLLRLVYGYSGPDFIGYGRALAFALMAFWVLGPLAGLLARNSLSWRRFFHPGLHEHWPDKDRRRLFSRAARRICSSIQTAESVNDAAKLIAGLQPHSAVQQQCLSRLALLDTGNVDSNTWKHHLEIVLADEPSAHRRRLLERTAIKLSDNERKAQEIFALAQRKS